MKILITGGAGFIGSAVVRHAITQGHEIVCVDILNYAGDLANIDAALSSDQFRFEKSDICDSTEMARIFAQHEPDAVMNLAAETHVDRSIDGPGAFIETNIKGTFVLLEAARRYWVEKNKPSDWRFHHISTDEVFGSLGTTGQFSETTPYAPNSPYSASKAASDHLVRAWNATFDLPVLVTNCSNNYGPYQFPEKLIPVVILKALGGHEIPIYGDGSNVRDWLYVDDHAEALLTVLEHGKIGRTYNIGGDTELTNLEIVGKICSELDKKRPKSTPYADQITFVPDRPGHDERYAIDQRRIKDELGWYPKTTLDAGLEQTVQWFLDHSDRLQLPSSRQGDPDRLIAKS